MILIDYSQIALSNIIVQKLNDEQMIRHMILNSIRMYNKRYRDEYGQLVICADGMNTWRKEFFPEYKASRKKGREESKQDWNEIFRILQTVRDEIRDYLPYKVVHLEGVEADDVIGTLTMETQEFGQAEPVMIISSDKDFIQLQKYKNVKQFSPIQKKFLVEKNPQKYLREHIIRGDKSDGVPNFLSDDEVFVENRRQKPITKKNITEWLDLSRNPEDFCDANMLKRWKRNESLVDLTKVPDEIRSNILEQFENDPKGDMKKVFDYFIKNRMMLLMEEIDAFKEQKYKSYHDLDVMRTA